MWKPWKRSTPAALVEAIKANEHAAKQLESANDMHAEALSLTDKLLQIRQRNHFGHSLENLNWSKQ